MSNLQKISELKIKDYVFLNLENDDGELVDEEIENLTIVISTTRIQLISDMIIGMAFVGSIVFIPLYLLWIWRWIGMYRKRKSRFLILVFKNSFGNVEERYYIFDRENKNIVNKKIKEINDILVNLQDEKIRVKFKKYQVLKLANLDRNVEE